MFKQQQQQQRQNINASKSACLSIMATSMRLADSFDLETKEKDNKHDQFMSIYDFLKLNKTSSKQQKLNYSNSSFSFEIDASSIVDETFDENDLESGDVSRVESNNTDLRILLDLEKLKLI